MPSNIAESREMIVHKDIDVVKTICFAISCIISVLLMPIVIVKTNGRPIVSYFVQNQSNLNDTIDNYGTPRPSVSIENLLRADKSDLTCKCRFPFYPATNCTICYYIPSYYEKTYRRFELFDKETAVQKCKDELKGEIPHSEYPKLRTI